ncbi:hypothetical protein D8674_039182 [Pyrus ussuriensis x Pyrus communis]|uniref:Uncharacterized protein n=1 Tax=Pyrus ussuriensis x Pyrus communis TaxID=2448454 RepID=A0A5N5I1D8_9ROSA|nr:hypothetical protein D8674_039189 [Pyrus ussuriensis x Pyrus communis]KAB2634566.1 hypothetical protein D8674_039182 [Pyrus ussuriensis x Pyrus communis]
MREGGCGKSAAELPVRFGGESVHEEGGLSIREMRDGRFLVRFLGQRDMQRVDTMVSKNCIRQFLRVKILFRTTDAGNCCEVCKELKVEVGEELEEFYPFKGLDVKVDLRGNILDLGFWKSGSGGLIRPDGVVTLEVENMVLKTYEMDEATNRVRTSLNKAVQANEKEHVNLGGTELIVNRDDDFFDMDSIIEAVTREHKGKKRSIQEVEVEPWEPEGLNHIMLNLNTDPTPQRKRHFMYDPIWGKEEERGFVGSWAFQIVEKLKWVRKGLKQWGQHHGWNSKRKIEALKNDLFAA